MIKTIDQLTDKEISVLKNNKVDVIEMLDCMRFKVIFNEQGIIVKSAKGKIVDDVDCLVNIFYRDIMDFSLRVMAMKYDDIYNNFGECEVTLMYMPKQQFNKISYNNYHGNRYIFCNLYTKDKTLKDERLFMDICSSIINPYPYIDTIEGVDSFDVRNIIKKNTYSGNSIDDIEGVILSSGNVKCKIIVNDTTSNIDPVTKKIYRDIVLEDFAKVIGDLLDSKSFFDDNDDYVSCICNMFYEYVNVTELFRKVYFEPDDLLPPSLGNVGDIDVKYLPSTAKIFCYNKLYMNILRLLLITFKTDNISKFDSFNINVKNNLCKIFDKINT
jgi:hypothetical protein